MDTKRNGLLSSLIRITVLILVSLLVSTSISAQNADYTTYTDADYGWSVAIPTTWQSEIRVENPDTMPHGVIRRRVLFIAGSGEVVTIDVWHDPDGTPLPDWFDANHAIFLTDAATLRGPSAINAQVAGLDAIAVSDIDTEDESMTAHQAVVFRAGDYVYRIEYTLRNGAEETHFRNMLATFSFGNNPRTTNELSALPAVPPEVQPRVANCGGYYDPSNNPFPCCSNGGNCTWWARYRRPDFGWDMLHNARDWWNDARQLGYPTGQTPVANAVPVWGAWNQYGHVAYIESVSGSTFYTTEMDCWGGYGAFNRTRTKNSIGEFLGFIYWKHGPPGKPSISGPTQSDWIGKDFTVQVQPGSIAHPLGYADWQVQVDDNSDFSSPVYNQWVTSTNVNVSVPMPADAYIPYYIRVRQGDTVNQSSGWSSTRTIYVVNNTDLTLINPTGSPNAIYANPRFRWTDMAGMTDYEFYVVGDNGVSIHETIPDAGNCDGFICNAWMRDANPGHYITNGNYEVWMRGIGDGSSTAWGGPYTFAIDIAPPTAPIMDATTGLNSPAPVVNWTLDDDSVRGIWFNVIVAEEATGTETFNNWYYTADVCNDRDCSLVSPVTLQNGTSYIAYVSSWGAGGFNTGGFAASAPFSPTVEIPGLVTRSIPSAFTTARYAWTHDPVALWYHFQLDGSQGNVVDEWYEAAAVCDSGTCLLPDPLYLTDGAYEWTMAAWGPGGMGEYDTMPYTIDHEAPTAPTLTAPSGNVEPGTITLTWDTVTDASWWHVVVAGPNGYAVDQWLARVDVCSGGVCHIDLDLATLGTYYWSVEAWGPGGMGARSDASFDVAKDAPGLVQRSLPTNFFVPSYRWTADANASWYHFVITGTAGTEVDQWYATADVCADGTCTLPEYPYLSNGAYEWTMAAWGIGGMGEYDTLAYTIDLSAPALPTITAPSGDVGPGTVSLTWDAITDSSWAHITLTGDNGYALDTWVERAAVCSSGVCTVELDLSAGAYDWWLGSWGPGGMGEYANRTFNVVAQ